MSFSIIHLARGDKKRDTKRDLGACVPVPLPYVDMNWLQFMKYAAFLFAAIKSDTHDISTVVDVPSGREFIGKRARINFYTNKKEIRVEW